jgi:hypothetical protein
VGGKAYVPTGAATIVAYGLLPPASMTLAPVADSYARAGAYAGTNFGGSPQLIVKKTTSDSRGVYNRVTYLKFDLTGVAAAPSSAKLNLTVSSASLPKDGAMDVQVYFVADTSWSESGLTWNNAPGLNRADFSSTGTLLTTQTISTAPATVSVDLTRLVTAHRGQVVTLQLMDASIENVYLVVGSRESASGPPKLVITF